MDGSILLKQSGNVEKINMSSYPRGSYVLKINFGQGDLETTEYHKVMVQ